MAILEKERGPLDRSVAESLDRLADALEAQNRFAEALPKRARAARAWGQILGEDHPELAGRYMALADLCRKTGRDAEAARFRERAIEIKMKYPGP